MEKNIFEGAKFGDKFVTRDGRRFSFLGKIESLFGHHYAYQGLIEDEDYMSYYNDEGKSLYAMYKGSAMDAHEINFEQTNSEEDSDDDIVSRYQESIDEKKLDELATAYMMDTYGANIKTKSQCSQSTLDKYDSYKAGYRKALES